MLTIKTSVKFINFMSKFKSLTFPSHIVFMEPIQLGHQKSILAFNFCANFAFHMVDLAIFPYE